MKSIRNIGLMSIISYKFPITAISSILHRITGVVLLIATPLLVIGLGYSLAGPHGYDEIVSLFTSTWVSFFFWVFLSSITYHIFAGVRHMIMDMGFGEGMGVAKATSLLTLVLGILFAVLWGCYLWL
ncbi:succinate dehydrogenase, cytochrome b556 subunit [Francisella frigiditurris]|uniref:Succinate dehydrogenase cytochrome b556 subunit n=1 Tax=Francisella frigiditurris TaxID=1542390 RepID=A0A1J0KTR7_9GAMM|nr:succinate dehydrogenase, cytochrome b556 subunit [Francisella frigiditurris]APC97028.1 succinate dehydrogenase, cytochrome b556 subunit [Francisella frigiditurris]